MTFKRGPPSKPAFAPAGTILSYSLDSQSSNPEQRSADFNHFSIYDSHRMIACHAFTWYTMWPDPDHLSCYSKYGNQPAANILEHDGSWHHVAITWTAAHHGTTKVYKDGLLMAEVKPLSACATLNNAPVEYCRQQTWQHCTALWSMPMTCNCQGQSSHVASTEDEMHLIHQIM